MLKPAGVTGQPCTLDVQKIRNSRRHPGRSGKSRTEVSETVTEAASHSTSCRATVRPCRVRFTASFLGRGIRLNQLVEQKLNVGLFPNSNFHPEIPHARQRELAASVAGMLLIEVHRKVSNLVTLQLHDIKKQKRVTGKSAVTL
jgi:hypothetical protein